MTGNGGKVVPALTGSVFADLLSQLIPGTNTIGTVAGLALGRLVSKRLETARAILADELRAGEKTLDDVGDIEEAAAITYRYARAATEGAARLNLRLMAKVISGQAYMGNLVADEFLYYADILASLRREEVVLLGTLHRLWHSSDIVVSEEAGHTSSVWKQMEAELVPVPFPSNDSMRATAGALTRTGLLMTGLTWDDTGLWLVSPLLDELLEAAPFDAALQQESDEQQG